MTASDHLSSRAPRVPAALVILAVLAVLHVLLCHFTPHETAVSASGQHEHSVVDDCDSPAVQPVTASVSPPLAGVRVPAAPAPAAVPAVVTLRPPVADLLAVVCVSRV